MNPYNFNVPLDAITACIEEAERIGDRAAMEAYQEEYNDRTQDRIGEHTGKYFS